MPPTSTCSAAAENKPIPGQVDALDLDNPPERPLSLFTRLALTARDEDDLVRLYRAHAATPSADRPNFLSARRLHRALAQMRGGVRRRHEPMKARATSGCFEIVSTPTEK